MISSSLVTLTHIKERYESESDSNSQHNLVADYLLQVLQEKYERLILSLIISNRNSVTKSHIENDLQTYMDRGRKFGINMIGAHSWIEPTLRKLIKLGLIEFVPGINAVGYYRLTENAIFLQEWWETGKWNDDYVLGLNEWTNQTRRIVTP